MRLVRLKCDGFGAWRGEVHFPPDRLTLLVDENERGKSTLLAAIAAGLYGVDDDRRNHRVLTPAQRWRPWDGGPYRVELELETGGRRLLVMRDFDRNTIEVWNDAGQEITAEFREGKDEFPVGWKLLGLDAGEFEKCAFVRQGELDQVVPGQERDRRASTLHARLENAADTRVGDTNAIEALRVLEQATAAYTCAELDSTVKVETAISRLEARREYLATEIATVEHELERITGPLEELARLSEHDGAAREALAECEAERRESRWAEVRRQLERQEERLAALEDMRQEALALEPAAGVPLNAEAELRAVIARLEERQSALTALGVRRRAAEEERQRLEGEIAGLSPYATCSDQDADRLVSRASEIRRVQREHEQLVASLSRSREALAARGFDLDRIKRLTRRFATLPQESQDLLRGHPRLQLAFHTEVARIEQVRAAATALLRALDSIRHRRRVPGWVMVALGLGAALGGGAGGWLQVAWPWLAALAGGGVLALAGLAVLVAGLRFRAADYRGAQERLAGAEDELSRLRVQQRQIDSRLAALAASLGNDTFEELLAEWHEYVRATEESGPIEEIAQQIRGVESERTTLGEEATRLLEGAGGGPAEPGQLDSAAGAIRRLIAARERLAEFDRSWAWLDEEQRTLERAIEDLRQAAVKILASGGLRWDATRSWVDHLEALSRRVAGATRHTTLVNELIPQAERQLLDPRTVEDLRSQILRFTGESAPVSVPRVETPLRSQAEIEARIDRLRLEIEQNAGRRVMLQRQVERADGLHTRLAEFQADLERGEAALRRTRRFKRSIELARATLQATASDTHRRWAEFLNVRVGELLGQLGTQVGPVRFGEDLDFSVRLPGGQQSARGKAMLQLSSGACDQLHLAVRLAISEYLSRGREPLPLLIDDAFATSDDERARAGMRALIERFGAAHQIIVVSCHRARYRMLAEQDPELYAERVHWLDSSLLRVGAPQG